MVLRIGIILPDVSSYYKLKRAMAYVVRFITGKKRCNGPITAKEVENAERIIIRTVQKQAFQQEIKALSKKKTYPKQAR